MEAKKKINTQEQPTPQAEKKHPWDGMSKERHTKFDYDGDEFYDEVFFYAFNGASNAEIACAMGLYPNTFTLMVNGNYAAWDKAENEHYSERLKRVLERARNRTLQVVKAKYIEEALGGKRRLVHEVHRKLRIDGEYTDDEEIQSTYAVTQPNMQALSLFLYHHDPEYRKVQRNQDVEASDIPQDIDKGIDITQWIDQEVKVKTTKKENKEE